MIVASIACYAVQSSGVSKLVINEVCSKNVSVFLDEDGTVSDYVELYNDGWLPYLVSEIYLSDDEDDLEKFEVPLNALGPGEYQTIMLDENTPFQISDSGETLYLSWEGKVIDQIECVALKKDSSYCRLSDGGQEWTIRTCTPGGKNTDSYPILSAPTFSCESGFYKDEFDLELFCEDGQSIFYTLDGSIPSKESNLYQGPIHICDKSKQKNVWSMREDVSVGFMADEIYEPPGYCAPDYLIDKCTIIRAVCVDEEDNESEVISSSYFVGFQEKKGYEGMNVLSVITDPNNLFDYESGIYVKGWFYDNSREYDAEQWYSHLWWWQSSNYTQRGAAWEREACLQFFDQDGILILTKECGMRIQGAGSRGKIPRSFNLYARNEYDGSSRFEAEFFGTSYEPQRMTFFAGGDDNLVKVKDALVMSILPERNFSTMDFEPYVLFLDGEYWGCYWLTEKYDDEYFAYHYNVDKNNVVLIKHGKDGIVVSEEEFALYEDMFSYIVSTDLSVDENYQKVCELIDIDSFLEYYAAEIYIARWNDWPSSNFALWRTKEVREDAYSDGKWRWILFDVNSPSMEVGNIEKDSFKEVIERDALFSSIMKNEQCRKKFADVILNMAETEFRPEKINVFLDEFESQMKAPLEKEYARFYGKNNDKSLTFENTLNDLRTFFEGRYVYIKDYFDKDIEVEE
ncbi:CotH kinase family protein [Candidatus Merdisoma sp. JLR.KK006]|uniref:CotH kinase family protein n=1 Tax=Candidatus Merdisoma sp. JLR.KK006 TaxID=3112626 RepID=UPI002FF29742